MLELRTQSSTAWLETVLADFDVFLTDHAACERKASAAALALASRHRDRPALVSSMIDLAVEELAHYRQVWAQLAARGLQLAVDRKDAYVNELARCVRHGTSHLLLDRLLVAAVVEARGCERFGLVGDALPAGELRDFYRTIERSEARHRELFVDVAREECGHAAVADRLDAVLDREAEVLAALPLRPALH